MPTIKLQTIGDICDKYFYIPDYQRGYRWEKEQVRELLEDLKEFYKDRYKLKRNAKEIYCVQPLVVTPHENSDKWDVIDGQQRLTTIFIILSFLEKKRPYTIEYQTRANSKDFLEKLSEDKSDAYKKNADFYFMHFAYKTVEEWLNQSDLDKKEFLEMIKERVNFIWYELDDPKESIKVFTRLNIGKISLTESELIKALFLNRNNFNATTGEKDKLLTLVEIANEWDKIEYRLQDDRFWLFFHETDYKLPTRIDFILNLARGNQDKDPLKYNDKTYPTFSYFYDVVKESADKHKKVSDLWKEIYRVFSIIDEWYNDEEIYHYIGYLTCLKDKETSAEIIIKTFLKKYTEQGENKISFKNYLKEEIYKKLKDCRDLDYIFEEEDDSGNSKKGGKSKTYTRPLLLLHNVQTIVNQNDSIKNEKKYDMPDFIRFPFHLFKKENWDVEHVRPNNLADFQKERKTNDKLKYLFILRQSQDAEVKKAIKKYDKDLNNSVVEEEAFKTLWESLNNSDVNKELTNKQKNKIWNYVLLDSSTNREYGNACYSIKRDYVLKKEKGIKPKLSIDKSGDVELKEEFETAFVPICTRKVFSKEYTQYPNDLMHWTERDAAYYRMDIEQTLWWYLFKNNLNAKDDIGKKEEFDHLYQEYFKNSGNHIISFAEWLKQNKNI